MGAQLAAHGRLARDPRTRETKSGVSMTTTAIAVSVESRGGDVGEEATLWRRLVGFGRQADDLARHRQGEVLSSRGRLQLSRYTASASEARDGWRVTDDSAISSRAARPGGGRRSSGDRGRRPPPAARDNGHRVSVHDAPLDDPTGSESGR